MPTAEITSGRPTPDGTVRLLYFTSGILIVSGLFHIPVWLLLGGGWEGPVSWRKPILFGLSTGLTVLSMGWLYPKLKSQRWDRWLCVVFAVSMLVEVGCITFQQWRRQPSHFNESTPFDASIERWMTILISIATLVIFEFTRRSLQSLNAADDMKLAIRSGMLFLSASCLIGFVILFYGKYRVAIGGDPSTYGEAGVTKFPHGIVIHALQLLPILSWLMRRIGIPADKRYRCIGYCSISMAMFLVFSVVQTLGGRSRFDPGLVGSVVLVFAILLVLPVVGQLGASLLGMHRRG